MVLHEKNIHGDGRGDTWLSMLHGYGDMCNCVFVSGVTFFGTWGNMDRSCDGRAVVK